MSFAELLPSAASSLDLVGGLVLLAGMMTLTLRALRGPQRAPLMPVPVRPRRATPRARR